LQKRYQPVSCNYQSIRVKRYYKIILAKICEAILLFEGWLFYFVKNKINIKEDVLKRGKVHRH
ncbi:MAG TPA: hypothetical protein PLT16_12325, partial [Daejeonella sp.]|nr:hypothetical protein [Daejeonella sp.]